MESVINALQQLVEVEVELFEVIVLYSLSFVLTMYLFLKVMVSVYYSGENFRAKLNALKYFCYLVIVRVIVYASGGDHVYLVKLSSILNNPPGGMVVLLYFNVAILLVFTYKLLKKFNWSKEKPVETKAGV